MIIRIVLCVWVHDGSGLESNGENWSRIKWNDAYTAAAATTIREMWERWQLNDNGSISILFMTRIDESDDSMFQPPILVLPPFVLFIFLLSFCALCSAFLCSVCNSVILWRKYTLLAYAHTIYYDHFTFFSFRRMNLFLHLCFCFQHSSFQSLCVCRYVPVCASFSHSPQKLYDSVFLTTLSEMDECFTRCMNFSPIIVRKSSNRASTHCSMNWIWKQMKLVVHNVSKIKLTYPSINHAEFNELWIELRTVLSAAACRFNSAPMSL